MAEQEALPQVEPVAPSATTTISSSIAEAGHPIPAAEAEFAKALQANEVKTADAPPPPPPPPAEPVVDPQNPRPGPVLHIPPPSADVVTNNPTDSLSLGALRGMVAQFPKPKQYEYSYHHADSSPTRDELEEFFSYVEIPGALAEGKESWQRGWEPLCDQDWPNAPDNIKKSFIRTTLEHLEHKDAERRFEAARRLNYLVQGTPMYTYSPDEQLRLILRNCTLIRELGAVQAVYDALRSASGRWNVVSAVPDDSVSEQPGFPSLKERQEFLEEINGEIAIHLGTLYFMVEIFRGDDDFAEELMTLAPPLPIYLFGLVANLREKNAKGYPVKKLLLLVWKSLLACLGGHKDISRVKALVREIEGLKPDPPKSRKLYTKVSPSDLQQFRQDIIAKYPTYQPPVLEAPISDISLDQISAASAPTPLRPLYPYHDHDHHDHPASDSHQAPDQQRPAQQQPMPATPAPSPPPSPNMKPKKQQFQTDQNRPFVLPFSRVNWTIGSGSSGKSGKDRYVPQSIDEAGELYRQNIRISTDLWQTVKVREECIADETGVGESPEKMAAEALSLEERIASLNLGGEVEEEEEKADPLQMLYDYETKLQSDCDALDDASFGEVKKLKQRIQDVKRLHRTEIIYRAILPNMQSAVIVLLKLLLATVTANNNLNNLPPTAEDEPPPELSTEETDIIRHREITSKSVSAIIILTLKWLKTSHVMKFHYFAQLLVDSNCLLLILKLFGLQEVSNQVRIRNEVEHLNFFRYCSLYGSMNPPPRPGEEISSRPQVSPLPANGKTDDGEVEMIHEFSSRSFFSVINFLHILQKLTKRKLHRVLLLVQYKSSAILKRILKVSHPLLQLYALKAIKSQVPYCGRKWRQSNMKVITAIYLNCRPDLHDEWLTTNDIDGDVEDSLSNEQALRGLVKFFNQKHYSAYAPLIHRRSSSHAQNSQDNGQPPESPSVNFGLEESFPPARSIKTYGQDAFERSKYGISSDGYLEDYEMILGDILTPRYSVDANGVPSLFPEGSGEQAESAWSRLGEILGEVDDVSDSESVGSIGYLSFSDSEASDSDAGSDDGLMQSRDQWADMSPDIIHALEEERDLAAHGGSPRSPRPRRGSSEPISPALRPVLQSMADEDNEIMPAEDIEYGPAPSSPHSGPAVDEVEAVFGE